MTTHPHLEGRHAQIAAQPLTDICAGHLSHDAVASKVRMLMRTDLDHEAVCTMARDRIVWLAGQLAKAEAALAALPGGGVDGWVAFADRWPKESAALDNPSIKTRDTVLVTNNIKARDRMGRMSHVWLASPIQADGEVVAFTQANWEIRGLTHWKDAALSPTPPPHEADRNGNR